MEEPLELGVRYHTVWPESFQEGRVADQLQESVLTLRLTVHCSPGMQQTGPHQLIAFPVRETAKATLGLRG